MPLEKAQVLLQAAMASLSEFEPTTVGGSVEVLRAQAHMTMALADLQGAIGAETEDAADEIQGEVDDLLSGSST
jgi:predicted component of type VI protein secretion system